MSGEATTIEDADESVRLLKPSDLALRTAVAGALGYGAGSLTRTYITPAQFAIWAAVGTAAGSVGRSALVTPEGDTNQLNMGQMVEYGGAGAIAMLGSGHSLAAPITFAASAASRASLNTVKRYVNFNVMDEYF